MQSIESNENLLNVLADATETVFLENEKNFENYLLLLLFSTLDLRELLDRYFLTIRRAFNVSGIVYNNSAPNVEINLGNKAGDYRVYNLNRTGSLLGTIRFSTNANKITTTQEKNFRRLANIVALPLQNALVHLNVLNQANTDPLTKTMSRNRFDEDSCREIESAIRFKHSLSVILLDIDNFKRINDQQGHDQGDQVLKAFGHILNKTTRDTDLVFRIGGDEFVILLPKTDLLGAFVQAERFRSTLEREVQEKLILTHPVTTSMGVAMYNIGDSKTELLKRADNALYQAKEHGRNMVMIAD